MPAGTSSPSITEWWRGTLVLYIDTFWPTNAGEGIYRYGMITAKDIAQQIGVSISTVGRAMADDPRISAETKAMVRRAAEKAGYAGNMPARVMRGGRSNLIGLIIPDVRNDFYAAIAQALSEICDSEGSRLVLSISGDDRDTEARQIRELVGACAMA